MPEHRRKVSPQCKAEAVQMVISTGKPIAEVAGTSPCEPVDTEAIGHDLDLLVRAQMNHVGYVGCSQLGKLFSGHRAGLGVLCRFREAARSASAATAGRPRAPRPVGRRLCGPRPGQGTAGTGE